MGTLQISRVRSSHNTGIVAGVGFLLALVVAAIFLAPLWPFSKHAITRDLEEATSATVTFAKFHTLWFPHPGCVATGVTLLNTKTGEPIGTIKRLQIIGSYSGLIGKRKHLLLFEADQPTISATQTELPLRPKGTSKKQIQLDQFLIRDGTLKVKGKSAEALTFAIPQLAIRDLGAPKPGSFSAEANVPLPEMTINAAGSFGPLVHGNINSTPVSGNFKVVRGSLATFNALRGKLIADGRFSGTFAGVDLEGTVASPDFELSHVGHALNVSTQFRAHVALRDGEVTFRAIDGELGKTRIHGTGVISPIKQDAPGFLNLAFDAREGSVDDLLWLFSSAPQPEMSGPIRFHADAALAHKPKHFLQEIILQGKFVINNARFSSPVTQTKLEKLSKRAEGRPKAPPTYTPISLLSGDVDLHEGVAHLSNVEFRVDGADANGGGTFNVEDKKIDLNGKLRMKAQLSDTTKGFKSKLLKLLDPFYKKHGAGADVPVSITGTTAHPNFSVHVLKK